MDDDINEVEQVFVIFLQVVDAVDPDRVDLQSGRNATLGIILDDDCKCVRPGYRKYGLSMKRVRKREEWCNLLCSNEDLTPMNSNALSLG